MTSLSRHHRAVRIRDLNDRFRADPDAVIATEGFLLVFGQLAIPFFIELVRDYRDFTPGDPYAEHDSGNLTVAGHQVFWRIVYATPDLERPSADPADPSKTHRVLQFLLMDEFVEAA